jgi:uncharacterized protein YbbK (DUF523 family)
MKKPNVLLEEGPLWLVSSCLVGLKTRYDGKSKPSESCLHFLSDKRWIPVCPEQLGGLSTPRKPAHIGGGDGRDVISGKSLVLTETNDDVSEALIAGARQVFKIYELQNIAGMCVKARSPSCGLIEILGVTSSYLLGKGVVLKEF